MDLTEGEMEYLRCVEKIGRRRISDAGLEDVERDLDWPAHEFVRVTRRLRCSGHIFVSEGLVRLSPLGQNALRGDSAEPTPQPACPEPAAQPEPAPAPEAAHLPQRPGQAIPSRWPA